jgi:phage terminase Nu1 subunit (DNA packaging protein)
MAGQTAEVIARLFDLTERRIRQLAVEGIIPRPERGQYDLVGCVRGYIKHLRERAYGGKPDVVAERGRLLKAQADRAELEVRELRGELVPSEDLGRALEFFVTSARSRLLALPRKLALTLAPENSRDAESKIEIAIHALLEELASDDTLPDWLTSGEPVGEDEHGETRVEAATAAHRKRVG